MVEGLHGGRMVSAPTGKWSVPFVVGAAICRPRPDVGIGPYIVDIDSILLVADF